MLLLNSSWNAVNFRTGLIRAIVAEGHELVAAAPPDGHEAAIEALGARFFPLAMAPRGRSPIEDLGLLARIIRLVRAERPALILAYTAKPNIYGGLAARWTGVPIVNNIAGLGSLFNERGPAARIVRSLYRFALARSERIFFQNSADQTLFIDSGLAPAAATALLPGSGVDLDHFRPPAPRDDPRSFTFLLVARLLREKGIADYAEAARTAAAPDRRFALLGPVDPHNPAAISRAEIAAWEREGIIDYLGEADDVREAIAAADCVVLPSFYREGTPRALLEAAAMGRPIITTDMPGCRDVVESGANGWIVPPRAPAALAAAMTRMVALPAADRQAMGAASRLRAETLFDERIVVTAYLKEIDRLAR